MDGSVWVGKEGLVARASWAHGSRKIVQPKDEKLMMTLWR